MCRSGWAYVGAVILLSSLPAILARAVEPSPEIDVRDRDGNVLIAADQILSYDWTTHTLALDPSSVAPLAATQLEGKRLISGVPFSLCVGGRSIYDGVFTHAASSKTIIAPVIVMAGGLAAGANQLHLQLGYPLEKYVNRQDPRNDPRIRDALLAVGKLVDVREDRTQWIADSLKEMQTIKPGMTREELLKVFVEEGGVSNRSQRRYAYRNCPYMKVDVKFHAPETSEDKLKESPLDTISQISTPFLEAPIAD